MMIIELFQLSIPTSIFLINKKGYPVLSKQHQNFVRKFINLDIQVSPTLPWPGQPDLSQNISRSSSEDQTEVIT